MAGYDRRTRAQRCPSISRRIPMLPQRPFSHLSPVAALALVAALLLSGCRSRPAATTSDEALVPTDSSYLAAELWSDGRAEVAFYRVERTRDQYGRPRDQQFLLGTYLVKHRFSPARMTKVTDGSGVSSFKYALFYEFESGSYQYKRNWVVNARQRDLRPFKQSFTSFDWCSNLYRELAFPTDGPVEIRKRSDDYGNRRENVAAPAHAYPLAQIPLLVRGLDFAAQDTLSFSILEAETARITAARAVHQGIDTVDTPAGAFAAERIAVTYEESVSSPIGEESARTEVYWRGTGPERLLVQMQAERGRYRMTLVEHLRTAYWQENLWPMLERVSNRP